MIPRAKIQSLRKALPVPEYFRLTNHFLKRIGKDYVTLCPFHKEKTPSCFLYDERYVCYGCRESGDVIDAHMKLKKTNFLTALAELSQMAGISQYPTDRTPGRSGRINTTRKERESSNGDNL